MVKTFTALALMMCSIASACQQVAEPVHKTVCEILERPSAANGTLVRVTGTVKAAFEYFALPDATCGAIWVDFANDNSVRPVPTFTLVEDANLKAFEQLMSKERMADVVLIGRLDGVDEIVQLTQVRGNQQQADGSKSAVARFTTNGFGHLGSYRARLSFSAL